MGGREGERERERERETELYHTDFQIILLCIANGNVPIKPFELNMKIKRTENRE